MENKVKQAHGARRNFGKTLKKISIIVCIVGVIASLVGANVTTISPKSTYSAWGSFGYDTTTKFSETLMFYYFMLTAIATIAIYSFGELLDNVIQKREIQEKLLEIILANSNQ